MSEPCYSDDLVTLYHGDCREIAAWLEADVLVTDPPYGVAWSQDDYLSPGRSEGQRFPVGTRRVLVWKKPNDSGFFHQSTWRLDWEPVFVLGKWPRTPANDSSVLSTSAGSHRQYAQGIHPHAKPIDLLGRLILKCPPGTIADPFSGSGSTLVAAKQLGRHAIGVELEERYCEIAARRLAQDTLFGGVA